MLQNTNNNNNNNNNNKQIDRKTRKMLTMYKMHHRQAICKEKRRRERIGTS
jgi:hypothetical protein